MGSRQRRHRLDRLKGQAVRDGSGCTNATTAGRVTRGRVLAAIPRESR
jgi:hypothetical protein